MPYEKVRLAVCDNCDKEKLVRKDSLPEGWIRCSNLSRTKYTYVLVVYGHDKPDLLCPDCCKLFDNCCELLPY